MKTAKRTFKNSRAFLAGSKMPAGLSHHPDPSQPFNPANSECIQWLIQQPEIQQYIFNKISLRGAIVYDPITKTWSGANPQKAS